jgi:hypothetical protein
MTKIPLPERMVVWMNRFKMEVIKKKTPYQMFSDKDYKKNLSKAFHNNRSAHVAGLKQELVRERGCFCCAFNLSWKYLQSDKYQLY